MLCMKDMSKLVLMEDPATKEIKLEEAKRNQDISKACEAVTKVRAEVDRLSEKVAALEAAVHEGKKVEEKEFLILTELLMVQLLNLDGIEAEGEAKMQRRIEVRRVQSLVETVDILKAQNSNPFSSRSNGGESMTTKWEAFDSGVGSSTTAPPMSSPMKITNDWEKFD